MARQTRRLAARMGRFRLVEGGICVPLILSSSYGLSLTEWSSLDGKILNHTNHNQQCQPKPLLQRSPNLEQAPAPLNNTLSNAAEIVRCVSSRQNDRHLVAEIVPAMGNSYSLAPRSLRIQHLPVFSSAPSESTAGQWIEFPDLFLHKLRLLGNFNDRVLFLDTTFWVCTWEMTREVRAVKRHF